MSRLSLTLVITLLLLGGCDRGARDAVQDDGALAAGKESLAGTIDHAYAGEPMPQLTLRDPEGRSLDTAGLQGTPVLVNLWATWCVPCRKEMPLLDELAGDYGEGLKVLTVSQDRKGAEAVVPYFAQAGLPRLEPWLDPASALGLALETNGLPATVLFDAKGREVWRVEGEYDWSSAEAREAIAEAVE